MQNKRFIKILIGLFILIFLIAAYAFGLKNNKEPEENLTEDDEQTSAYTLINKPLESFDHAVLGNIEILKAEDGEYKIKGYEALDFNQDNMNSLVSSLCSVTSANVIEKTEETNLSEYGLTSPIASADIFYTDGTSETLLIGNKTPDSSYSYVMTEKDKKVCLLDEFSVKRYSYTLNDLINKNIPIITNTKIVYVNVKSKNKEELEMKYLDEKEGNADDLANLGMQTLTMFKPYNGAVVYPSNLQEKLLYNLNALTLGNLIEPFPSDLAKYALSDPELTISLKDTENEILFKIGKESSSESYYCMVNDRREVFEISKDAINPFINYNVIDFIEKFVSLMYRTDVDSIELNDNSKAAANYKITLVNENSTESTTEDASNNKGVKDTRAAYINGALIDSDKFTNLYQLIAGITFDSLDNKNKPEGTPLLSIKYNLTNKGSETVNYYPYKENPNFYIAEKNGNFSMLVNKQSVDAVFKTTAELSTTS